MSISFVAVLTFLLPLIELGVCDEAGHNLTVRGKQKVSARYVRYMRHINNQMAPDHFRTRRCLQPGTSSEEFVKLLRPIKVATAQITCIQTGLKACDRLCQYNIWSEA